jgi:hypothetical protein
MDFVRQDKLDGGSRHTNKQNRKCTHNVTLQRVRVTAVAVENQKYYIF